MWNHYCLIGDALIESVLLYALSIGDLLSILEGDFSSHTPVTLYLSQHELLPLSP